MAAPNFADGFTKFEHKEELCVLGRHLTEVAP